MAEPVEWRDDGTAGGTPFSPRFGDRYRSELGGLEQARDVFLQGCGLPAAWAGQPQWTVLETGFGLGLNFLVTWLAWRADPQAPRMLHFVSTEAFPARAEDVLRSAQTHPELLPLAEALAQQFQGLLPGVHRLSFEGGRVLLTLCIGDTKMVLREQSFEADSVYLDGFSPGVNPDIWDLHTFRAVARCCRRGTRVATWTVARSVRDALAQCGFIVKKVPGTPPKRDNLQGEFNPAWTPKSGQTLPPRRVPGRCVVVGAGLAGAAVAASLARRGWQVLVLEAGDNPAAGASGLPAGVLAPHVSPDDNPLSRLSRSGVRLTLQQAHSLLTPGEDWAPTGVLEHGVGHARKLPSAWQAGQPLADAAAYWTLPATAAQRSACELPAQAPALWHVQAGWIKPARLVQAWLATPGVTWRCPAAVDSLHRLDDGWQLRDADGQNLATADLVVLAAGHASRALALSATPAGNQGHNGAAPGPELAFQPVRGQVSWALSDPARDGDLPPFPVNGQGSLVPSIPAPDGSGLRAWVTGATFERDQPDALLRAQDHGHNLDKLRALLPEVARRLSGHFDLAQADGQVQAWAGVRCTTPSRLPAVGPLALPGDGDAPGVWVCSGMGSRGLSFSTLCAELLAARLHTEPLPLDKRLAEALRPPYTGSAPG